MAFSKCKTVLMLIIVYNIKHSQTTIKRTGSSQNKFPGEQACNKYCECKAKRDESYTIILGIREYKEIVCKSWQKFVQLGSDPEFQTKASELKTIQMYVQDEDENGIQFLDVKDHPYQESLISEDEHLRTLIIDLSKVVAYKKIKSFEISNAIALKFVNPNFFKLFDSLEYGVSFYNLENLRKIPYIPIPVEWKFTVKRLLRLELIKGCGMEICTNYRRLRYINILIGKSYTKLLEIENLGLPNRWLEIHIAVVEPRVHIHSNIFKGKLFQRFDYQTFGSMNLFDLTYSHLRETVYPNRELRGYLRSKTIADENLLAETTLINDNKILPNFHSPFFYNIGPLSKKLKLKGVPANTLVSIISVIPTMKANARDYNVCKKVNKQKQIFSREDTKRTLRYTSVDISDTLEAIPDYVTDLTIYTLHAVISKDVTIDSRLKFTLYCETLSSSKNAAIYQRASRESPSIEDFSARVILLKDADATDEVFAKMSIACHELLKPHKICNKYCECKSKIEENTVKIGTLEYKEVVCKSWQKFVQLGSNPEFQEKVSELETIQMYVQDEDRNGIEFVDVKDDPYIESLISEDEHLRTLIIDLSKVVAFKKIKFFEISNATALKFVNPNFFKLFDSLEYGVSFYNLENLRKIPYIPILVEWKFTVKRLLRLELIKGCGMEICTNYRRLRYINILIGKSYTKLLEIENLGLPNRWLEIHIAVVEPRVHIHSNIFKGKLFQRFDYQTFGSMNLFDLTYSHLRETVYPNRELRGYLRSKTIADENLLAEATLIDNNKILPNFHSPFFYNRYQTSKVLKLKGVPAGTIVSVISVIPTVNATGADYQFCTKINNYNYPKEIFTEEDTKRTLRYTSVDISNILKTTPDYVKDLTIFTLHAIISEDFTIRSSLTFTLYCATMSGINNAAIYQVAPKKDPAISDFSVQVINLKVADRIDPVFAQMSFVCMALISQGTMRQQFKTSFEETTQWKIFQSMPYHVIDDPQLFKNTLEHLAVGSSFRSMENFIYFVRTLTKESNHVPYLSLDSLKELLIVLQDAGKMALKRHQDLRNKLAFNDLSQMNKENLVKILKSQSELELSLLEDSYRKTESLASIANRTRMDLSESVGKLSSIVEKLSQKVVELNSKVSGLEAEFKSAVKRREAEAYAEAASAAASAIFSIFSGGFDPNKAIRAINKARRIAASFKNIIKVTENLKKLMTKLKDLGRKIKSILKNFKNIASNLVSNLRKKITRFFKKGIKELSPKMQNKIIDTTKMIHEKGQALTELVDALILARRSINVVKLGFDPGDEAKVKNLAKDLTVLDVLEWDLARDHVTGMMDASLSIEVPETLNFKTALLKVLRAGKAETQARIDFAKAGEEFSAAEYSWKQFVNELADTQESIYSVKNKIKELKTKLENIEADKIRPMVIKKKLDTQWELALEEFRIKIELYMHITEFCQAYLYFHLQSCPPELQFDLNDNLDVALRVANRLQYQSVQQLKNLYPPPQTFHNKTVFFRIPTKCECLENLDTIKATDNPNHDNDVNKAYSNSAACLEMATDSSDITEEMKKEMFSLSEKCKLSLVNVIKEDNEITFDVPIASSLFGHRDRVRVDEVQVFLKGAKTESGKIEVWIQTAGISQDRYRGKVFSFTGENWIRVFSYYSESVVKKTDLERKNRGIYKRDDRESLIERRTVDSAIMEKLEKMELHLDRMEARLTEIEKESKEIKGNKGIKGIRGKLQQIETFVKMNLGNRQSVLESANVHKSFYGIYRVPTPFTTWIISVTPKRNHGLDLSGLYEIEVRFSGSFIAVARGDSS